MGLWEQFPYTNLHSLNLDWIVTKIKELNAKVIALEAWSEQHKGEYVELKGRVDALENEIDTFETQIRSEFDKLKQEQQAEFEALKAETKATITAEVNRLERLVNEAIANLEAEFNRLLIEVRTKINDLETQIQLAIINLNNTLDANNEYMMQWVENRLQDFINSLPEILTVEVYNPYRGRVTDIQQAINDIYSIACVFGLTAEQYDSLQLTATEYDNKALTAMEYDQYGYKLLNYPDPDLYMISPFTGQRVLVKDVVMDLAHLHMGGVTAEVYDLKELTAETYDALELTAFNYDWFGDQLLPA